MWGAGQMMFNKILIVTRQSDVDIHNYEDLVRHLVKDCESGIRTSSFHRVQWTFLITPLPGLPMASKMGIDATVKIEEEITG